MCQFSPRGYPGIGDGAITSVTTNCWRLSKIIIELEGNLITPDCWGAHTLHPSYKLRPIVCNKVGFKYELKKIIIKIAWFYIFMSNMFLLLIVFSLREKKMKHKTFYGYPRVGNLAFIFVYVSVRIIYYHRTLLIVDWVYFLPKYCIILISLEVEGSVPKPRTQHWNGAIISFWQMIQLMIEKTHRQAIFFSLSTGGKEPRKRLIHS